MTSIHALIQLEEHTALTRLELDVQELLIVGAQVCCSMDARAYPISDGM